MVESVWSNDRPRQLLAAAGPAFWFPCDHPERIVWGGLEGSMTRWDDGYVSDIHYTGGVYREQLPSHLDAICLVSGVSPPVAPGASFNYCELGCGLGETAMVAAAAYPYARIWGFDFNPVHIAQASANAAQAGLENLVLAERSFQDLAEANSSDIPPLDYVVIHGVWSWISLTNRAHIVAFLRKHLRPGGLLYLSYNALPGRGAMAGLQHLLFEAGRCGGGNSGKRLREAVAFARRVHDAGGSALPAKQLEKIEAMLAQGQVAYLSHEYLNEHWSPDFCADVAKALEPAKLSFIGSASMLENFLELCLKPEQLTLVTSLPVEMQQTVLDYFCPRAFRRDVFIRGVRRLSPRERHHRLAAQQLALVVPARSTTCRIEVPLGEATLHEAFYAPALARLGRGKAAAADLAAATPTGSAPALREVVGMLIGSRQVLPAPGAAGPDTMALADEMARVRRFNRARIAASLDEEQRHAWLASALLGSAIRIDLVEMLVYEVLATASNPVAVSSPTIVSSVCALMVARGISLREGETSDAPELRSPEVEKAVCAIVDEKREVWLRIGLL